MLIGVLWSPFEKKLNWDYSVAVPVSALLGAGSCCLLYVPCSGLKTS